jgi:drug/metabolite transporter (DMT)-like permease
MGTREWALLGALALIWGSSFYFNEIALTALPPFTVVFWRVALATAALYLWLRAGGHLLPSNRAVWWAMAVMAAANNLVPFALILWGQTQIASSLAAVLIATVPLFTVLIAHLATSDERLTPARLGGVSLGLAGVAVLVGPSALEGITGSLLGQLAVLAAAFGYAASGIYARLALKGVAAPVAAAGQLGLATLLTLPLMLLIDRPWALALPGPGPIAAVLALALGSTAVAYVVFYRLLARAGATNVSLVTFLVPVTAIVLGVSALGETLEPRQLAGMALIGLGLAALDGRPLTALRRRIAPASRPAPGG